MYLDKMFDFMMPSEGSYVAVLLAKTGGIEPSTFSRHTYKQDNGK